jgi:hypothetical protein
MLRAAQARNSLAQPQLRAAYSWLRLQSCVLRSQSGNGIWRGQDSGVSIVVLAPDLDEFDEYPFFIRTRIGKNNRRANGGLITDIKYR